MSRNDEIEISAELVHETDDAYLIEEPGGRREWVPKSAVVWDGKVTFTMPEWLAEKRDLI